jgi:hypothetical protein
MAMLYHPDVSKSLNAHDQFILITEAYETLIDPFKRRRFDRLYDMYRNSHNNIPEKDALQVQEFENFGRRKAEEYSSMRLNELLKFIKHVVYPYSKAVLFLIESLACLFVIILMILEIMPFNLFGIIILGYLIYRLSFMGFANYRRGKYYHKYRR